MSEALELGDGLNLDAVLGLSLPFGSIDLRLTDLPDSSENLLSVPLGRLELADLAVLGLEEVDELREVDAGQDLELSGSLLQELQPLRFRRLVVAELLHLSASTGQLLFEALREPVLGGYVLLRLLHFLLQDLLTGLALG